ncbi:MAG: hypothetical protein LUH19_03835, partial [Lachnospiraceae bacterium]|nr:hypothetical protein [Lachnospiraceae bacterium]
AIVCGALVGLIHTAQGGIYWYNAGVHYVAMHGFFMLLLAGVISLYYVKNKAAIVCLVLWSMLGALLVSGSNYVTSLQGILMLATVLALWLLCRSKRCFLLLPCLAVYGYGFYKNIIAPGNNVRKTIFEASGTGMDAVSAVIHSFQTGLVRLFTFGGWMMFFVLILVIPFFWNLAVKTSFCPKLPGLVSLYSFCFYCTGFTSSFYSMGTEGLGRTLNAVKFTYQLLLLFNELYWICWIAKRQKIHRACPLRWWFFPLIGGIAAFYVLHVTDPAGTFLPYGAYYYVHTGQAYNFHSEYLERVETIKSGGDVVEVTPYLYRPWFLSSGELSEDYTYEPNVAMANWYGKIAIICK